MVEEKQWFQSKTIWGGLIAATASLAGVFGISVDFVAQTELTDALVQLAGAVGALFAIYGRLSATEVIS